MVSGGQQDPLLRISNLTKTYTQGRWWEQPFYVKALDGVSLNVEVGKTLALVGSSGAGKTTLAMCAAMLELPDFGNIFFRGRDIQLLADKERTLLRPKIQMCFQDSTALSARYTARQIIEEPLRIQRRYSPTERSALVCDLMETVGLSAMWRNRHAHQLSGGQRQRLAIARSLALQPNLLILDEPFVGLDNASRAQIVNLLLDLQARYSLTYLYILHDLELVRYLADSVAVMDQGKIIEHCSVQHLSYSSGHSRRGAVDFGGRELRDLPLHSSICQEPTHMREPGGPASQRLKDHNPHHRPSD